MAMSGTLREVADLSASQWGMFTTGQAAERGVSRLSLARLADSGGLVRIARGVYRDSGSPSDEYEELRAAWLSTNPSRLAAERLTDGAAGVVVSGPSAAWLHQVGDLLADQHEFTTPVRRQSQRPEIQYRRRALPDSDVTIVHGLPATTLERTIADLVEAHTDLSLVADVLTDAARTFRLDFDLLAEHLSPLAARHGYRKRDGQALLEQLTEAAGLDMASLARRVAASPQLGEHVAAEYLKHADLSKVLNTEAVQQALRPVSEGIVRSMQESLRSQLAEMDWVVGLQAIQRELQAVQLEPAMEAMRQVGKIWAESLARSAPTAEVVELAQRARSVMIAAHEDGRAGDDDERP